MVEVSRPLVALLAALPGVAGFVAVRRATGIETACDEAGFQGIRSDAECRNAAMQLGLGEAYNEFGGHQWPRGCIVWSGIIGFSTGVATEYGTRGEHVAATQQVCFRQRFFPNVCGEHTMRLRSVATGLCVVVDASGGFLKLGDTNACAQEGNLWHAGVLDAPSLGYPLQAIMPAEATALSGRHYLHAGGANPGAGGAAYQSRLFVTPSPGGATDSRFLWHLSVSAPGASTFYLQSVSAKEATATMPEQLWCVLGCHSLAAMSCATRVCATN